MRRFCLLFLLATASCATAPRTLHLVTTCSSDGYYFEIWERPDGSQYVHAFSPLGNDAVMELDGRICP